MAENCELVDLTCENCEVDRPKAIRQRQELVRSNSFSEFSNVDARSRAFNQNFNAVPERKDGEHVCNSIRRDFCYHSIMQANQAMVHETEPQVNLCTQRNVINQNFSVFVSSEETFGGQYSSHSYGNSNEGEIARPNFRVVDWPKNDNCRGCRHNTETNYESPHQESTHILQIRITSPRSLARDAYYSDNYSHQYPTTSQNSQFAPTNHEYFNRNNCLAQNCAASNYARNKRLCKHPIHTTSSQNYVREAPPQEKFDVVDLLTDDEDSQCQFPNTSSARQNAIRVDSSGYNITGENSKETEKTVHEFPKRDIELDSEVINLVSDEESVCECPDEELVSDSAVKSSTPDLDVPGQSKKPIATDLNEHDLSEYPEQNMIRDIRRRKKSKTTKKNMSKFFNRNADKNEAVPDVKIIKGLGNVVADLNEHGVSECSEQNMIRATRKKKSASKDVLKIVHEKPKRNRGHLRHNINQIKDKTDSVKQDTNVSQESNQSSGHHSNSITISHNDMTGVKDDKDVSKTTKQNRSRLLNRNPEQNDPVTEVKIKKDQGGNVELETGNRRFSKTFTQNKGEKNLKVNETSRDNSCKNGGLQPNGTIAQLKKDPIDSGNKDKIERKTPKLTNRNTSKLKDLKDKNSTCGNIEQDSICQPKSNITEEIKGVLDLKDSEEVQQDSDQKSSHRSNSDTRQNVNVEGSKDSGIKESSSIDNNLNLVIRLIDLKHSEEVFGQPERDSSSDRESGANEMGDNELEEEIEDLAPVKPGKKAVEGSRKQENEGEVSKKKRGRPPTRKAETPKKKRGRPPSRRTENCAECDKNHEKPCALHRRMRFLPNIEVPNDGSVKQRALRTLPKFLTVGPSSVKRAGSGVWTEKFLPPGLVFGPYEGRLVKSSIRGQKAGYSWQVWESGKTKHYVEAADDNVSNWMRFANCADYEEQQNLVAFQYKKRIYYRTYKPVLPHTELLVWYGEEYAEDLGVDLKRKPYTYFTDLYNFKCDAIYTDEITLMRHKKNQSHETPRNRKHQCPLCPYSSNYNHHLARHMMRHKKNQSHGTPTNRKQQCPLCPYSSNYKSHFNHHMKQHNKNQSDGTPTNRKHQCPLCPYSSNYSHHLARHLMTHTKERPYECDVCNKSFIRKETLKKHQLNHCLEQSRSSNRSATNQSSSLTSASLPNSKEESLSCPVCAKSFLKVWSRKRHEKTHVLKPIDGIPESSKQTSTSNRSSTNQSSPLTSASLSHAKERSLSCWVCGKSFLKVLSRKQHEKIHTRDKLYGDNIRTASKRTDEALGSSKRSSCCVCGKSFSNDWNRRQHEKKELKPIDGVCDPSKQNSRTCSICGKLLANIYTRRRHEKTVCKSHKENGNAKNVLKHINEVYDPSKQKSYSCSTCSESFSSEFNRRLHEKKHIDENPLIERNNIKKMSSVKRPLNKLRHKIKHRAHNSKNLSDNSDGVPDHSKQNSYFCSVSDKSFSKIFIRRQQEVKHVEKRPDKKCVNVKDLLKHLGKVSHHSKMQKSHPCTTCGKSFTKDYNRVHHERKHIGEKPNRELGNSKNALKYADEAPAHSKMRKSYICTFCSESFTTDSSRRRHEKNQHGKMPNREHSNSKSTLKYAGEISARSKMQSSYICTICGESFTTDFSRRQHERKHVVKKYNENRDNVKNISSHSVPGGITKSTHEMKLTGCRPDAKPVDNKLKHTMGLAANAKKKCSVSSKSSSKDFRGDQSSMTHIKRGPNEKHEKAKDGLKQIDIISAYSKHSPPYICVVCGKSFTTYWYKLYHESNHAGYLPHKCQHCDQSFKLSVELEQHIAYVHIQAVPFRCFICKKGFSRFRGFRIHQERCHPN